jgi:tetratricopeptide (TPR) repeat protein
MVPLEHRFIGGYLKKYLSEPQTLKNGPPATWELRSKAMNYETFFQSDDVAQAYADAVKLDPNDASLRFALAMAFLNQKNLDGLRAELDQAVAIDSGYYTEYMEMSRYFLSKNMPEDAEYFLSQAEKVNPQDPRIYAAQYNVYVNLNAFDKAGDAVKKQLELGYDGPELLGQLAGCEKALGHYAQAEKAYNDALAMIPSVDMKARQNLLVGLGEAYELDRKIELAIKTYIEALNAMEEGHAKDKIWERVKELDVTWSPFLNPSPQ